MKNIKKITMAGLAVTMLLVSFASAQPTLPTLRINENNGVPTGEEFVEFIGIPGASIDKVIFVQWQDAGDVDNLAQLNINGSEAVKQFVGQTVGDNGYFVIGDTAAVQTAVANGAHGVVFASDDAGNAWNESRFFFNGEDTHSIHWINAVGQAANASSVTEFATIAGAAGTNLRTSVTFAIANPNLDLLDNFTYNIIGSGQFDRNHREWPSQPLSLGNVANVAEDPGRIGNIINMLVAGSPLQRVYSERSEGSESFHSIQLFPVPSFPFTAINIDAAAPVGGGTYLNSPPTPGFDNFVFSGAAAFITPANGQPVWRPGDVFDYGTILVPTAAGPPLDVGTVIMSNGGVGPLIMNSFGLEGTSDSEFSAGITLATDRNDNPFTPFISFPHTAPVSALQGLYAFVRFDGSAVTTAAVFNGSMTGTHDGVNEGDAVPTGFSIPFMLATLAVTNSTPALGTVIINEFSYDSDPPGGGNDNDYNHDTIGTFGEDEFIEIFNTTNADIDVSFFTFAVYDNDAVTLNAGRSPFTLSLFRGRDASMTNPTPDPGGVFILPASETPEGAPTNVGHMAFFRDGHTSLSTANGGFDLPTGGEFLENTDGVTFFGQGNIGRAFKDNLVMDNNGVLIEMFHGSIDTGTFMDGVISEGGNDTDTSDAVTAAGNPNDLAIRRTGVFTNGFSMGYLPDANFAGGWRLFVAFTSRPPTPSAANGGAVELGVSRRWDKVGGGGKIFK